MSALGNYIHLHKENYLKYGTTYKDSYDSISSYEGYVKSRLSRITPLSDNTVNVLKQRLKGEADGIITKDAAEAQRRFQENIDKIYEAIAQKTTYGVLGQMHGSSAWKTAKFDQIKGLALSDEAIEQKRALIGQIYNLIDKINMDGAGGNAKQSDINTLVQYYNKLSGNNLKANKSSLGIVQEDIDNYSYYNWISNVAGDFGEMMVAAAKDTCDGAAIDITNRTIEGVVGNQRSGGSFSKAEIARDLSPYGVKTTASGDSYSIQRTQDKVDVEIKVNQEDVFATVKNYYNPQKVTLQSQTSLFNALVALQREGNFGNHFLNAHAGRNLNTEDAKVANDAVRFEMAYDALVGGNPLKEGASQANVFVIFDRQTGKVMVKQTKDILLNEIDKIIRPTTIQGIRLKNKASKKIQDRIANILMQAHQINMHISYNISKDTFN